METGHTAPSLERWDIGRAGEIEWTPWGNYGNARAKVLGGADGYTVVLIEAEAGYRGTPHEHEHAEFFYLLAGTVRNQGQVLAAGDAYAAAAGSAHTDFEVTADARYLLVFRL
jgi:quercetin dioxygenase-like cupin family protein